MYILSIMKKNIILNEKQIAGAPAPVGAPAPAPAPATGNLKSEEPTNKKNLPDDFKLASIISSNQIGVKKMLMQNEKETIKIYESNEGLNDLSEKNLDSVYSNNFQPKIRDNNRFYSGDKASGDLYKDNNNYLVYFINDDEFGVKFKRDSGGIHENLKSLCNSIEISSSYFNLMNTSFYMLLGEDRYSNFKLNNMENKVKIVDTNIVNYFKNDITDDNLEEIKVSYTSLVGNNTKAKLVLCGYKKETKIYLKLFDLIRKFNIKNAEGKDYVVRFMPNDIMEIKDILIEYLQYEYYNKFQLIIHNYKFKNADSGDKFNEIFGNKVDTEKKKLK